MEAWPETMSSGGAGRRAVTATLNTLLSLPASKGAWKATSGLVTNTMSAGQVNKSLRSARARALMRARRHRKARAPARGTLEAGEGTSHCPTWIVECRVASATATPAAHGAVSHVGRVEHKEPARRRPVQEREQVLRVLLEGSDQTR
eukprot:scaffold117435_cov71-Phaeocystis_antarctica.AAC.4